MVGLQTAPVAKRLRAKMPRRKQWTRAEYEHFINIGAFTTRDRLELIEGDLLEKMSQNGPHAISIALLTRLIGTSIGANEYLRVQLPFAIGRRSMPEPDFAIVTGNPRDHVETHPETATLIIEVSDSTLTYDRTTKVKLYARAAVPEYWILNLNERVFEVYRKPVGTEYTERNDYDETQSVLLNGQTVAVKDLLP